MDFRYCGTINRRLKVGIGSRLHSIATILQWFVGKLAVGGGVVEE